MILYAPGDAWAWSVAVRYADAGGTLLDDRERWTVRVGKGGELTVERAFLGTKMDDSTLVPSADPKPEILKGRVEPDGTLSLKDAASDPVAARVLRRLLKPDRTLPERLAGTPLVRHAVIREAETFLPGSGLPASLRVEATLVLARLGGRQMVPPGAATPDPRPLLALNASGTGNRGGGGGRGLCSRLKSRGRRSHPLPHGSPSRSSKGNHL